MGDRGRFERRTHFDRVDLTHGFHGVPNNPMTLWLKMSNAEANVATAIAGRTEDA